jgi:hypothetical protein
MAIEIIQLSIALFLLWAFVYYCYRDYRLDMFREELFVIRAELFEFAANGDVPFDSPAYTILRNFINQMIRYAHTFTILRFGIVQSLNSLYPNCMRNVIEEWKGAVERIESEETRNHLYEFHNRVVRSISKQLVMRSFLLTSFAFLGVVVLLLVGSTQKLADVLLRIFREEDIERLESQVIEIEQEQLPRELVTA